MKTIVVMTMVAVGLPAGGFAQTAPRAATGDPARLRYQIGQMERVLEGAVEHGAKVWRDRFQSVLPADMLLSENARVRGFRLEGYGVLFDVEVPPLESSPLWSFQTLDQNDLGLGSALDSLRTFVEKTGDVSVRQALKRVELQVGPAVPVAVADAQGARATRVSSRQAGDDPARLSAVDPQEAFRAEVKDALMEAMLDHGRGLDLAAGEWLTVAARRISDRPALAPADSDAATVLIRMRGADLNAFLGGQIQREEALSRMDVRVF